MGEAQRVVVALSGASGAILGIRLLEALRSMPYESHLVLSPAAAQTIVSETNYTVKEVEALADVLHPYRAIGATIASGSFRVRGMVIAPCSVKTLSSIAYGITGDLIARAADVNLKEGRPVVALFRETPLHLGHLRALTQFAEIGGIVFPPLPAFYARPSTLDEMVEQIVGRVLERLGIENELVRRWGGLRAELRELADE